MPRNYTQVTSGGTASSGRAYTPQVTPDNQDDDTANVTGHRNVGADIPDDYDGRGERRADSQRRRRDDDDVINRRDLQPTYEVMDRNDRHDYHADDDRDHDRRRDRDDGRRERWYGAASKPHSFGDRRDRDRDYDRDEVRRVADNNYGFGNPPAEGRRGLDAAREDDEPDYMHRRRKEGAFDMRHRRGDEDRDTDWDDGFRNAYPADDRRR